MIPLTSITYQQCLCITNRRYRESDEREPHHGESDKRELHVHHRESDEREPHQGELDDLLSYQREPDNKGLQGRATSRRARLQKRVRLQETAKLRRRARLRETAKLRRRAISRRFRLRERATSRRSKLRGMMREHHTKDRQAIRDDEGKPHQRQLDSDLQAQPMNKGEPHLREADGNGQERAVVPATPSHFHSDNSRILTPIVSSSHVYGAHSTVLLFSPSVPMSSPVAHTSQAHGSKCSSSAVSSPWISSRKTIKKNTVLRRSAILGSISTSLVIAHSIFTYPEEMSKHIYTQR